jgi:hypothetical protein
MTRRRSGIAAERRQRMEEARRQYVEPEIVKHEEKIADVTAVQCGSDPTIGDDCLPT